MTKEYGKTIKLFLLDGEPNGIITCELSNWTGKAYKIPRKLIKNCSDREDLLSTGVYLLFGKSDEINDKDFVYIGEAENIYKRLKQHLKEKDFWNEAIIFISKDENLNKAHIKYLENRFHQIAKKLNRFILQNNNIPTLPAISESDQAEMEEFLNNSRMLVNVLGYKVFENIRQNKNEINENRKLSINTAKGTKAQGEQTSDGFVVFKNSIIADKITPSLLNGFKKLRNRIIEEKIIENNVFQEDYLFNSPSAAASVVMGRTANGLEEWKNPKMKSLKTIESEKV